MNTRRIAKIVLAAMCIFFLVSLFNTYQNGTYERTHEKLSRPTTM